MDTDPRKQTRKELMGVEMLDNLMNNSDFLADLQDENQVNENKPSGQTINTSNEQGYISGGKDAVTRLNDAEKQVSTLADTFGLQQKKNYTQEIDRTKRNAKIQKYGDTLSLLLQTIGAFAGASVPKIDNTTEATRNADYLRKLNEAVRNEDLRMNMLKLQEKLNTLRLKEQYSRQDEQYNQQLQDRNTQQDKQFRQQKELINDQLNKEKEAYKYRKEIDNDPNTLENKRAEKELRMKEGNMSRMNKLTDAQIKAYEASANLRDANTAIKLTGQGTKAPDDAYLLLYNPGNVKTPAAYLHNEGQALVVYNAILDNPNLQGSDLVNLRMMRDEGKLPSRDELKNAVARYWKSVMPAEGETEVSEQQKRADYKVPAKLDPDNDDNSTNLARLNLYAEGVFNKHKDQPQVIHDKLVKYIIKDFGLSEQEAKDFIENTYR